MIAHRRSLFFSFLAPAGALQGKTRSGCLCCLTCCSVLDAVQHLHLLAGLLLADVTGWIMRTLTRTLAHGLLAPPRYS